MISSGVADSRRWLAERRPSSNSAVGSSRLNPSDGTGKLPAFFDGDVAVSGIARLKESFVACRATLSSWNRVGLLMLIADMLNHT